MGQDGAASVGGEDEAILDLLPVVRRVVAARMRDTHLVDDLVQETLARMMGARARLEPEALVPYAIVTARNLIASHLERQDRDRRKAHLLADPGGTPTPEDEVLVEERRSLLDEALQRLPERERDLLVAHEVEGTDTATLAAGHDSTPGAIAAQLSRSPVIRLFNSTLVHKPAQLVDEANSVGWHTDKAYWPGCTSDRMLTAWIPLHDVTEDRSPLTVLDSSHRWPEREVADLRTVRGFAASERHRMEEVLRRRQVEFRPVPLPMPAGHLSFHH